MARLNVHNSDCIKLFGQAFREVHIFLDEFSDNENPDLSHREKRHNWNGVVEIVNKFSAKAGLAAIVHILRDIKGFIPDMNEVKDVFQTHEFPKSDW